MSEGGVQVPGLPSRYRMVERLGRGGSADVFLVEDSGDRGGGGARLVRRAMKVLRPDAPSDLLGTLRHEFRILASFEHPGLARVHDFGVLPDGRSFYTADFVEGRELGADGPVAIATACLALASVCRTLAYLRARGYTHNDIKPSNIVLGAAPESARLLDFGLAGLERAGARSVAGTPGYIAPERLAGQAWDVRSDLYSVGATLYRVLVGRRLHEHEDPKKALAALHAGWQPLAEARPDVPPAVATLCDEFLRLDPSMRPRHPSEVVARLGAAIGKSLPLETPGTSHCYALAGAVWGREAELATIETALGAAGHAGAPHVVVVRGGAGSGKTRLLRETAVRAEIAGWHVVHDTAPSAGDDGTAAGARTLILVDDAHAASDATWQATLAHTSGAGKSGMTSGPRSRIVVAVFGFDPDALDTEARQRLALLEASAALVPIALGPLPGETIGRMLDSLFGHGVISTSQRDAIARRSGGNPLLVEELVREMVETGALRSTPTGWAASDAPTGPAVTSVRLDDFLRRRFRDLPPGSAAVLRAVAVLGGRATVAAIGAVAEPDVDVDLGVSLLAAWGLGAIEDGAVSLAHAALGPLALDAIREDARRAQFARALVWLRAAGADDAALARAHRGAGQPAEAFACAARAGASARAAGEGRRATSLLEQALADARDAGIGDARLVPVLRGWGDALRMTGRHGDAVVALARCFPLVPEDAALERVRVASEAARAAVFSDDVETASVWLDRGQAALAPGDAMGAVVLRRVRANLCWRRGQAALARAEMEAVLAALDTARGDPEADALRGPMMSVLAAYTQPHDIARSQALAEQALALARVAGNPFQAAYAANNLGDTLLRAGDPARAAAVTQQALHDSEQAGSVALVSGLLTNLADAEHQRGAIEAGRRRLAGAIAVAAAASADTEVGLRGYGAIFAWREGDAATAERDATGTLATSLRREIGVSLLTVAAWAAAERGDRDAAAAFAARAAADARRAGTPMHDALAAAAGGYAFAAENAAAGGRRLAEVADVLVGLGRHEIAPLLLRDAARWLARAGDADNARSYRERARRALAAVASPSDADPGSVERILGEAPTSPDARPPSTGAANRPDARSDRARDAAAAEKTVAETGGRRVETAASRVIEVSGRRLEAAASRVVELTVGKVALRHDFTEVVGRGAAMQPALAMLDRLADGDATVLLLGETGTGKEVFARALHAASARAAGPFVAVNCAALPAPLFEAELFGHRKGAFTGATQDHVGFAEEANGGTLLLDEIGDLPLALQPKLLRMLDEGRVRPVGANRTVAIDVRVVAATNRDLADDVSNERFRRDLYFRLAVVEITLPPLRERSGDIPELGRHLLAKRGRGTQSIDPAALRSLTSYAWPGNVRELENELVRAAVLAAGGPIRRAHLSPRVLGAAAGKTTPARTLADRMLDFERRVVEEALSEVGGNRTRAARLLGITRQSLLPKLHKLGLARARRPKFG